MIDIKLIRAEPEKFIEAARVKNIDADIPALLDAGFLQRESPLRIMLPLRRLFYRAGLDKREIRILRGIMRQFDYHIHRDRQTHSP